MDLLTKSLHSFLSAHHPWGSPHAAEAAEAELLFEDGQNDA